MSNLAAGNGRPPTDVASPTQLSSNSDLLGVSDSSNSPRSPQTPQLYGRMRRRYPELGHVPLHRRGTSKTYERLEDLLKEAGYKETRIFTPETERTRKCEDDDDDATIVEDKRTSMVKDVVGFLAGLIPGVGASVAGSGAQSFGSKVSDRSINNPFPSQQPSPPCSPLANKTTLPPLSRHGQRAHHVDPHPTQSERPQIVIHPTTPHHDQAPGQQSHQSPLASPYHLHAPNQHPTYNNRPGLGSNIHLAPPHTTTNAHSPRPSRATVYLRHMASAPNVISKRHNSTPAGLSHSHRSNSRVVSLIEGDSHETLRSQSGDIGSNGQQPPLPASWLETVAKAVLFGGSGAHVGGPVGSHQVVNADPSHHEGRSPPVRHLRPSRSSLSQVSHNSRYYSHHRHRGQKYPDRGGLSDSTNFSPSTATSSVFLSPGLPSPMPPALFSQIERGRANRCVSEVSMTRVMCRSAPGSRSGSVVRPEGVGTGVERNRRKNLDVELGVDLEREARGRKRGVKRRGGAGGGWLKGKEKEKLRVPSLARMHVEGDAWTSNMKTRKRSRPEAGSVGIAPGKGKAGYVSEGEVEYESYSDENEDDEDEEEGEVNLATMLLPPKRQNSIRSLRKHLVASVADSGGGGAHAKLRRVHHPSSAGRKGGLKSDGRLRHQSSWTAGLAGNDEEGGDHVFRQGTRHNAGVLPPKLNSRGYIQSLKPAPLGRRNAGNSEDRKSRNSCSDDEDVDSFAGFFDVDRRNGLARDPMGSGRSSTSGQRLGLGSVWGVLGGRGS